MRAGRAATRHGRRQRDGRGAGCGCDRRCWLHDRHGRRRSDECWNDGGFGRRQEVTFPWRRRWRQHDEFAWPRRQEKHRGRWWRLIVAAPKCHHGPINNNQFFRWRRRNAEVNECKIGRPVELSSDHCQPAPGIPYMRTVRIAPQIGPISRRRVIEHTAPPDDLLATNRDHSGDTARVAASWMERQKLLITIDRVDRERRRIGILNARITAHWLFAHINHRYRIGRRRRVSRAFSEKEWAIDLRSIPGDLAAVGHFAHPQPYAREHIVQRESAGRNHLRERRRIRTIRTRLLRPDRARSGVERDRRAGRRIDERETARQRLAALRQRVLPGRVKNDDLHARRQSRHRLSTI
jgi:hypothetical protein